MRTAPSPILWDCHLHSAFSGDCETPMEKQIRSALDLGLKGITFTEHLDPDYPPVPEEIDFSLNIPDYYRTLCEFRSVYQDRLEIRFGIELGLQPHLAPGFSRLLKDYPFDFVIGSSHVVHGYDPYYPDYFRSREEDVCYREYFESILENLKAFDGMDAYGHIDYIVRYGPNQNRFYTYEKFGDILDEILKFLINKGIALELNTGGYAYGLSCPNPSPAVLSRYRELGGELLTIGADAHKPERLAYAYEKAHALLLSLGYTHYTVFKDRKPEFLPL